MSIQTPSKEPCQILNEKDLSTASAQLGRFVTEDKELISQSRKQLSEEELEHFVSSMTHFGYEKEELPGVVNDYIKGV